MLIYPIVQTSGLREGRLGVVSAPTRCRCRRGLSAVGAAEDCLVLGEDGGESRLAFLRVEVVLHAHAGWAVWVLN